MPVIHTIKKEHSVDSVLTDPQNIVMADEDAVYGVRRTDSKNIVVEKNTAMDKVSTGVYEFEFEAPDYGPSFAWSIQITYDDAETYDTGTITFSNQWMTSGVADTYFSGHPGASTYWTESVAKNAYLQEAQ
ncbi:hypothetical protein LCGC14_3163890, partial [marine sediment metagenome]